MDRKDTPDTVLLPSTLSSSSSLNSTEHHHDDDYEDDNNDNNHRRLLLLQDIASKGNGIDEDLSKEQIDMIFELYDNVHEKMKELLLTEDGNEDDDGNNNHSHHHNDWFVNDIDVCRRYLVARQWNLSAAQIQLESTIEWRKNDRKELLKLQFCQSPKAIDNPWSLSMRPIGFDEGEGRPICFTSFAESCDRWDVDSNIAHMILLMDACCNMIYQRRRLSNNNNVTASSRQWIFVIDFDGFSLRDASNPKSGIMTAKELQHYPEMMNMVILINAPYLFSSMFSLIKPFLDDRVKSKIFFVKGKKKTDLFNEPICNRLGNDTVTWIWDEIQDNYARRKDKNPKKQYWLPPPPQSDEQQQHDSRGMKSYVESEFYVKTPGDAYLEKQRNT